MTLTREQMTLLPGLLANAPPWARTQAFWVDFAVRATAQSLAADQDVFTPDSPVEYLYLVVDGEVQQTFGFAGEMWFCQDLGPGGFFGQQALFSSRHASRATTTADTLVFRLAAPDVRYLLERYPGLREFLLRETRAGRLRSIPLFESLSDDDIRWLAHLERDRGSRRSSLAVGVKAGCLCDRLGPGGHEDSNRPGTARNATDCREFSPNARRGQVAGPGYARRARERGERDSGRCGGCGS